MIEGAFHERQVAVSSVRRYSIRQDEAAIFVTGIDAAVGVGGLLQAGSDGAAQAGYAGFLDVVGAVFEVGGDEANPTRPESA